MKVKQRTTDVRDLVDFRETCRQFLRVEVVPHLREWDQAGIVPRELFRKAARSGLLAMAVPEQYGGAGVDDFRFNAIVREEAAYAGAVGDMGGITLQNDVCLPYFMELTSEAQRNRWLPGLASGEFIAAIAMTEPGGGSDLAGIQTRAVRDGDHWILNGSKTFITNGINADLVVVVARTNADAGHRGLSLFVVERGVSGFSRGRKLETIGMRSYDTAELFFDDVVVPDKNLLGQEGEGFFHLVANLPQERVAIALTGLAAAEAAIEWTVDYVKERKVFGRTLGTYQNSRFSLAESLSEVRVTRAFVDDCIARLVRGELSNEDAAIAKWWATEIQGKVIDRCLQLFGGYGYMLEYPIARAYADARVSRIYGGTNEIMKEIIGRSMGLE